MKKGKILSFNGKNNAIATEKSFKNLYQKYKLTANMIQKCFIRLAFT